MSQTVERAHKGTFYCSHHLLPPRHEERDHRVAFFVSGCPSPLPSTSYHPDTKNATTGSRSSCLGVPSTFYHPDTKNATTGSRSSCLGGPSPLPSTSYHPDTKNATTGSRSSCLGCFLHLLPPRHEERDHQVAFFVSRVFPPTSTHPRHEERDHQVAFFVSGVFPPPPTTQTRRTRPQGRVLRVWGISSTSYHPDTENATTGSRFFVSGWSLSPSLHLLPPRHEERDYQVASFVSGWSLCPSYHLLPPFRPPLPSPRLEHQNEPTHGLVLVFGYVPSSLPCLEHHNVPVWACSGARAPLLSVSLSLSLSLSPFPVSNISSSYTISGIYLFS